MKTTITIPFMLLDQMVAYIALGGMAIRKVSVDSKDEKVISAASSVLDGMSKTITELTDIVDVQVPEGREAIRKQAREEAKAS